MPDNTIPVIGFCAYSGTGKTTLLRQLIPLLNQRGLRVGLVKHSHHDFEIDIPGKDSYELRKAGAAQVVIGSAHRFALIHENQEKREPTLEQMLNVLHHDELDLILVEGFRHEAFPKVELHRKGSEKSTRYQQDESIIAIATDYAYKPERNIPLLDMNDPRTIADFICTKFL